MLWPCPGYNYVTSYFGNRDAPTKGATSYHNAIDVAAPQGANLIAISSGIVRYIGFMGSGGHTLIVDYDNGYSSTFCHIAPSYLVSINTHVYKGEVIAKVGPTYLDDNSTSFFLNALGKKTNGATTGCHMHFKLSYNGNVIDPLTINYTK